MFSNNRKQRIFSRFLGSPVARKNSMIVYLRKIIPRSLIVSCDWQVRPARPPCGTTTLGPISMATPQRRSLPSSSRTSSTPFSLTHASSPSWGTLLKGQGSNVISGSCLGEVFWKPHPHVTWYGLIIKHTRQAGLWDCLWAELIFLVPCFDFT